MFFLNLLRISGAILPLQYVFIAWCLIKQDVFMARYLVKHRDNFIYNTFLSIYT